MTIPSRSGCYISAVDAQFALVVSWNVATGEWFFCTCLLANMLWPGDSIPDRWLPTTFSGSQFHHPEKATSRIVTYIQYTIGSMYVIFTYAYFWWGPNQNVSLMWRMLVPMSQDVIPKKPFDWNRKPKPKIPRPLPLKRNPKKSKVGDILLRSFLNSFTLIFVFLLQGNGRNSTFLILKYVSNGPKPPPPAATKLSVSYSCFVNAANAHRKSIAVKSTNPNGMDFLWPGAQHAQKTWWSCTCCFPVANFHANYITQHACILQLSVSFASRGPLQTLGFFWKKNIWRTS